MDPPVEPPAPYSPTPGPTFNDPSGTTTQQYALNRTLVTAIDNAPPGATVRIALFSGSISSFRDAVINAYRRGVHVRLLINGHSQQFLWWQQLVAVLGSDRSKPSYATACRYGCFSTRTSTLQHAKLYLFSATGTARRVAMLGSGNPTHAQANKGWNDLFTLVDERVLYDAFVSYFDAMVSSAAKADDINYFRTVPSGKYRAVMSPTRNPRVKDYYQQVLENIRCAAAPGSGIKGRTKVTVAMGLWSHSRVGNAERLWRLDEQGCDVEAIVSSHDLDSKVLAWLRKPGRNGGITFRAASYDLDKNGTIDRYLHEKVVMIDGGYLAQRDAKITFMGTHNFTMNAFRGTTTSSCASRTPPPTRSSQPTWSTSGQARHSCRLAEAAPEAPASPHRWSWPSDTATWSRSRPTAAEPASRLETTPPSLSCRRAPSGRGPSPRARCARRSRCGSDAACASGAGVGRATDRPTPAAERPHPATRSCPRPPLRRGAAVR